MTFFRQFLVILISFVGSVSFKMKPSFSHKLDLSGQQLNQEAIVHMKKRQYTAKMTAWDRRAETEEQRQRRHEMQLEDELKEMEERRKEREFGVEQFILSGRLILKVNQMFL